jgi:hypothetical protein
MGILTYLINRDAFQSYPIPIPRGYDFEIEGNLLFHISIQIGNLSQPTYYSTFYTPIHMGDLGAKGLNINKKKS